MRPFFKSLFFTVLCVVTQGAFALAAETQPLSIRLDDALRYALLSTYERADAGYQDQARYGDMGPVLQGDAAPKTPAMEPVADTLAYPWMYVGQLQIRFGMGQYLGARGFNHRLVTADMVQVFVGVQNLGDLPSFFFGGLQTTCTV